MAVAELTSAAIGIVFSFVLYQAAIVIQRLYFSPLSAFPGPKLTAATYLVEIYYDIFKGEGGQLVFAHRKWHEQYGPIIRINPDELHIQDSSWYETLYAPSRPVRKLPGWGHRFNSADSAVGTSEAALYRSRRSALNSFFSKRKIAEFGPKVQDVCNRIMSRIEREYHGSGRVLSLSYTWECLASEIVYFAVLGEDPGFVESPNFTSETNRAIEALVESVKLNTNFAFLPTLMTLLPKPIVVALKPPVKLILEFWEEMETSVGKAQIAQINGKVDEHTMVGSLLQQKLPPQEATMMRLSQEAKTTVGAGVETVARTLSLASFHILDQPAVRDRLVEELTAAIPDPAAIPDWNALAALPYLSACVEEAVRLTYGVAERRSRAYDGGDLMYGEWRIPAGTFVGMSNYDVSHDEKIFPDSFSYIPERWLNDPKAPDGKALSRYNISFGKGMRSCVGMHLAYLELYLGLATFFRAPLAMEAHLYETDKSDVEMTRDCFVPRPPKTSKGVRVVFDAVDAKRGGEENLREKKLEVEV